ncbi:MAG: PAS domain S-box protein [Gammaproteobacteria bacterium]|nr:PAS domain S-box protein [Gammaproteobacteria bacterium]
MSFRFKTILGIAFIESVLLLILIISGLDFLSNSNEEQLRQRAETTSRLFANATKDAVLATDLATLESFVAEILTNPDIVYTRISSDGVVLAEGGDRAIPGMQREADKKLEDVDDGVFDVRVGIMEGGREYGLIEMGLSTSTIEQLLAEAGRWTVSIASLEVTLVAVFSFILGTYLTRQLQRLKSASETITRSGPGHQVEIDGNDEIAGVARAFNTMSASLQQKYTEQEEYLHSLKEMAAIAKSKGAMNNAILSASLDAMITIDAKGCVVEYNEVAKATFGWHHDEIMGQRISEFIVPPNMREDHIRGIEHYLITGESLVLGQRMKLKAQHKDGYCFPIEINISPIDTAQGPMFTAFIRDISKRLAVETELRLAAQAFESGEAMLISNAAGDIIRINAAFTRITGYQVDEVVGRNTRLLASGRQDAAFYTAMWRQLLEQGKWNGEIYNRRKNGEIFPEHLNISAVKSTAGETTHYVAHFIDISEQKNNEERLRLARKEAEQASLAKSRFLASMSHEIRTPMNGVLGILGLLKDTPLNHKQRQLIQTGRESGELLLSIINDILDFSKMEAGKLRLEHTDFDLHRLLSHSVELLRPQADNKGLALTLHLDPDLPRYVRGDPDRLRQILLNLINNAIKFTSSGHISLKASADLGQENRFILRCAVEDTGIGIPKEIQPTLFEEFTMADQSHSRVHEGTGLGLAICKRLVSLMDGSIGLVSDLGSGSTFDFNIALEATDAHACENEMSSYETRRLPDANTRVLLAEDNSANQLVAKSILEHAGLHVDIVANGREALEAVRALPYDLILMDISMPEMDGMAATTEIRKLSGQAGKVPIVALTAHALSGDRERFLAGGMDDYLTKPIQRDATLYCIAHWTCDGVTTELPEDTVSDSPDTLSPDSDAEYVDEQVLRQLVKDTAPKIVPELLKFYIDDALKRVEQIQAAIVKGDMKILEFEAHTLGSSAAAHGNLRLHTLARRIEHLCQDDNREQALKEATSLLVIASKSFQLLEKRTETGFE